MSGPKLQRHIGLLPLVLYGIGDILGSGIYGLVGKVAGQMGNFVWLAFLIAFGIALMTGLSYAALGARYPKAAGSSFIVWKAFRSPMICFVVGLATLCSGLTSMATASGIFSGYFTGMVEALPMTLVAVGFIMLLAGIVFVGIRESLWVNALCTVIELGGLLIVIVAGVPYLGSVNIFDTSSIPGGMSLSPALAMSGAVLAFYSFIGFEDLLNVSEEVIKPKINIPLGLIISSVVASSIYMVIGVVAISVIPAEQLAQSNQPLVEVVAKAWPWFPSNVFSVIALFAVANTALLNFIMSSRLLYGLANLGLLPKFLAKVHARTKTPYLAVALVTGVVILLTIIGDVSSLARATSLFVLLVFFSMNVSLFVFQRAENKRKTHKKSRRWHMPQIVPILGALGTVALLAHGKADEYGIAGAMMAVIMVIYFIKRPTVAEIEKFERMSEKD